MKSVKGDKSQKGGNIHQIVNYYNSLQSFMNSKKRFLNFIYNKNNRLKVLLERFYMVKVISSGVQSDSPGGFETLGDE